MKTMKIKYQRNERTWANQEDKDKNNIRKAEIIFVTEYAVLVTETKELQDERQELDRTTNKC